MAADGDPGAVGASATVALCGSWEHEPPCPLAPHHTSATADGDEVRVRILFAAEPGVVDVVRQRIDSALAGGEQVGPDGSRTTWRLLDSGPAGVRPEEAGHAQRLAPSSDRTPPPRNRLRGAGDSPGRR